MPDVQLGSPLPYRCIPRSRTYTNVIFEATTSLIVAASSLQARFASFDEDGNKLWEPDGEVRHHRVIAHKFNRIFSGQYIGPYDGLFHTRTDFS